MARQVSGDSGIPYLKRYVLGRRSVQPEDVTGREPQGIPLAEETKEAQVQRGHI